MKIEATVRVAPEIATDTDYLRAMLHDALAQHVLDHLGEPLPFTMNEPTVHQPLADLHGDPCAGWPIVRADGEIPDTAIVDLIRRLRRA